MIFGCVIAVVCERLQVVYEQWPKGPKERPQCKRSTSYSADSNVLYIRQLWKLENPQVTRKMYWIGYGCLIRN